MRISLERTGGFAGISKKTTLDTANLASEEAKQLPLLVEAANFFNLPANMTTPRNQPDRFQYTLMVEDNGRQHTVRVSEAALPGTLRPLIEWVQTRAKK
ncbi:protealysin inhibitor emfourin [Chlorogloeopsis sp. ULAP02]|uniref:protealysin inhibitor emfourin n=1 Tax=Chlorogloeopsis sp. ULAP02 TaxID=3107926 RepID=UPI003136E85C